MLSYILPTIIKDLDIKNVLFITTGLQFLKM